MQRGFKASQSNASDGDAPERQGSLEPSVPLKNVVHNPGTSSLFPSFASLFDDGPAVTPRHAHELSLQRAVTSADVSDLLNPRMRELHARFAKRRPEDAETEEDASSVRERAVEARKTLDDVPRSFFAEDEAFELQHSSKAFASDSNLDADRAAQLDEAQAHLDAVEGALVAQLRDSSDDFFDALGDFRALWGHVSRTCAQVRSLRTQLRETQSDAVEGTMRVPRLACRQSNVVAFASTLRLVKDVRDASEKARALMLAEDFPETCRVIHDARATLDGPLKGVECLKHTAHHLAQFEDLALSYMGNQWTALAVVSAWDVVDVPEVDPSLTGADLLLAKVTGKRSIRVSRIAPLVEGLRRAGRLPQILQRYRGRFDEDARDLVKTVVAECAGGTDDDVCGEVASQRLAALGASEFQHCLDLCLEHLLASVCGAVALHNALAALLQGNVDPSVLVTNASQAMVTSDGDDLVKVSGDGVLELCEGVLKRVGRLVQLRKEQNSRLKQGELRSVWTSALSFAAAVERATGEPAFALRSALVAQARAFLEKRHSDAKTALVACLDAERWAQADVAPERQKRLDRLSQGLSEQDENDELDETPPIRDKRSLRPAHVEGRAYKCVWSGLVLLDRILDALGAAAAFPVIASEATACVVDLARFFESRTRQLVLFAGALHSSARLRTITAKHLGLASQSLNLVASLLPHVRAALSDALAGKEALLEEVDAVARDYADHHRKILAKFSTIIGEVVDAAGASLSQFSYQNAEGAAPFSPFVSDVAKNLTALHGVLAKQLPADQLQEVCGDIFALLAVRLPALFRPAIPPFSEGRERLVDDLAFLQRAAKELDGAAAAKLRLDEFVAEVRSGGGDPA
jgi:vacuolar protein sorting-associated protein 54